MLYKNTFILLLIAFSLLSCEKEPKSLGDKNVAIFDDVNLHFNMKYKDAISIDADSIYRLDAGRVLIKKIKLPDYELQPQVKIKMTLTSNGDPWDKSGSMFIIPARSDLSVLDFEKKDFDLKKLESKYPAVSGFEIDDLTFIPPVEILRFMTPFGVGHFSDTTNVYIKERKPLYIPHWEKEVNWEQDITQLLPLLEGEIYVGVYIDTWTDQGYNISAALDFTESTIPNHLKKNTTVVPLMNTVKYASDQKHYDHFYNSNLVLKTDLPENAQNAKLYYTTTGHGGHSTGDEFVKKENIIKMDEQTVAQYTPWRDDCASFRRFNPSSGIWVEKTTYKGKEIDERISSSDFSRSNWCPGSMVEPDVFELKSLTLGIHQFSFSIPEAQKGMDGEDNYWMVSSYLTYEN